MAEKYSVSDWFNIYNKDHLIALKNYLDTNKWPKHFIPADVIFNDASDITLLRKITNAWIKEHTTATRSASLPLDHDITATEKKRNFMLDRIRKIEEKNARAKLEPEYTRDS